METVMLKKTFIGVLFVALFYTFLIVGTNVNVTKAVNCSGLGTSVGGIIWENATWTLENSPYVITDTVQIPENVTLTIEPGVICSVSPSFPTGNDMFLVHGTIYAIGTVNNKIIFDGCDRISGPGRPAFFSARYSGSDAFVDLEYCVIKNGASFWWGDYGHFNLRRSELVNLTYYSYLYYPGNDVYIEYNKFVNAGGFSVGHSMANVYIMYNLFKGKYADLPIYADFVVENWASYYDSETIVKYNSFIDMAGIVLKLSPGCSDAAMTATENYWGTNDTEVIDSMIYDKKDDITCAGFIDYLPILTKPHPETPILLEDVNIDIDGIFREDSDDKWRCYTNITIRNNSYRNVTIPWVYVNAINITYIDETFEALDISGNETLNFVLQPQQEFSLTWTITEFGFTKEPRILWILFKTPIIEAYGTITLIEPIPEFPSTMILPLLMLTTLIATILLRKKRKTKLPQIFSTLRHYTEE
jgi:hypothetical protein